MRIVRVKKESNAPACTFRQDLSIRTLRPLVLPIFAQNAAGTLSFLLSSAVPNLQRSLGGAELPSDLSYAFVKSMEWLMLAQAQECVWQKAVIGMFYFIVVHK